MSIATEPDALARDSELLSQVLHEVLVEQAGEELARTVQWLHESANELRRGDAAAGAAMTELVHGLAPEEFEPCIRACALQLQLANIAEERERVRRRRHYDAIGVRQRESLMDAADLLRAEGADAAAAVRALHVELVLTAHPTEATRRSVLEHQLTVARLLDRLDDPRTGRSRRHALLGDLREALTVWWQTDEVRRVRPMVEDEVRRNLFFFEATLHDAVPEVLEELERGRSRCSASTSRGSTCASPPRSCKTRSRRCFPATATRSSRTGSRCSPRRSAPAGAGSSGGPTGRRASCCACSTRSRSRASRTASARCR